MGWSNHASYLGYGRINLLRALLTLQKGSGSKIYLIFGGTAKHWIKNANIFNGWKFSWSDVETVSDAVINGYATGGPVYSTARASSSNSVYLLDQGKRKWIVNPNVFSGWGFSWSKISVFSSNFFGGYITGTYIYRLSKGSAATVYLGQLGKKYWVFNGDIKDGCPRLKFLIDMVLSGQN